MDCSNLAPTGLPGSFFAGMEKKNPRLQNYRNGLGVRLPLCEYRIARKFGGLAIAGTVGVTKFNSHQITSAKSCYDVTPIEHVKLQRNGVVC